MIEIGKVIVSGVIDLVNVYDYLSTEKVNEPTEVVIKGVLKKEQIDILQKKNTIGSSIAVKYLSESQDHPMFYGVVKAILFNEQNNQIQIIAAGLECLIDLTKSSQSFQNTGLTYVDIIKRTLKEQGRARYCGNIDIRLKTPIIRFKETDWEFIRRLASYMGTIIYPVSSAPNLILALGAQEQKSKNLDQVLKETLILNTKKYLKNKKQINREIYISLEILTNQYFNLGDKVQYRDKTWYVVKKEVKTVNSILFFEYTLGSVIAYSLSRYGNIQLKGGSLRGKIKEVKNEKIKLQLDIDNGQSKEHTYFYPYRPATGNIMYSMPEVGEYVSLYFPNEYEENGYVVHGIKELDHLDKNNKFLKTTNEKKLALTPSDIELVAGQNKKDDVSAISLIDNSKISFETVQDIEIRAGGKIKLDGKQSGILMAKNFISIKQTDTQNQIRISGNEIEMKASKYQMFPTKPPKKFTFQGTLEKISFQGMDNNLSLLGSFSQGNISTLQQYAIASIPVCSFPQNPQIQNGIGVHVGRV